MLNPTFHYTKNWKADFKDFKADGNKENDSMSIKSFDNKKKKKLHAHYRIKVIQWKHIRGL